MLRMRNRLLLFTSVILIACGSTPPKTAPAAKSEEAAKLIKSVKPSYKETFAQGSTIEIGYTPVSTVDSVQISVDGQRIKGTKYTAPTDHLGKINYTVTAFKAGESQTMNGQFTVLAAREPEVRKVNIKAQYPHDPTAYTQGLLYHDGKLYESTGERGRSSIRVSEVATGKVLRKRDLDKKYFGEGLALLGGKLYQLTWEEGVVFVYDIDNFENRTELPLAGEGWGITTDGTHLYVTDGSTRITKYDAAFRKISSVEVADNRQTINFLNELEWINGKIWANVYTTDLIAVINPETGVVEQYIDCSVLNQKIGNKATADVLNGIAYDPTSKKIWLTGKDWDTLFEITI